MKIRWPALLVAVAILSASACSDFPSLLSHDKDSLILFKRVTLAADAPDRAEVEIEVRTGTDFSEMAPDGTLVTLRTSLGWFAENGPRIEAPTVGGHMTATLILPEPSRLTLSASCGDVEAQLSLDVHDDGSIQLDPS
jgi:hypothetical protein